MQVQGTTAVTLIDLLVHDSFIVCSFVQNLPVPLGAQNLVRHTTGPLIDQACSGLQPAETSVVVRHPVNAVLVADDSGVAFQQLVADRPIFSLPTTLHQAPLSHKISEAFV